jgi:ubiquitin fusion degradation protein 1
VFHHDQLVRRMQQQGIVLQLRVQHRQREHHQVSRSIVGTRVRVWRMHLCVVCLVVRSCRVLSREEDTQLHFLFPFVVSRVGVAARASPPGASSEYDLDSLLGWDRTRAAARALDERTLRERIATREREMERERQHLQRLGGQSRELSDMLAAMLARSSAVGSAFDEDAGPVLDSNGRPKKLCQTLRCFSFGVVDKQHLEMGDKIIFPPETLYHVNKLRLPFPLLFRIENAEDADAKEAEKQRSHDGTASGRVLLQHAGVLEFSAPEEHIYLPTWMMENLRLTEGASVRAYSELNIPQGQWVKLIPHSLEFSKLLREMGPKYFLEMALRHYSVLTKGQRILVQHEGRNWSLNVAETKPANTISLLGNLDLEVEFGIALDTPADQRDDGPVTFRSRVSGGHAIGGGGAAGGDDEMDEDLKRAMAMSLAESGLAAPSDDGPSAPAGAAPSPIDSGADEGWAVSSTSPSSSAAQRALQAKFGGNRLAGGSSTLGGERKEEVEEKWRDQPQLSPSPPADAPAVVEAEPEEEEPESEPEEQESLADVPANHSFCPSCKKAISNGSFALHTMHCARAFVTCPTCAKRVKKIDLVSHEAKHVTVACELCGSQMEQKKLRKHVKQECFKRAVTCRWCSQPTPFNTLGSHELACGDVTSDCSICAQPISRRNMPSHPGSEGCRIQCGKCDEIVASKDIVAHTKDRCVGRMVNCPHCKLSFAFRDTTKHQEYCGSRTEQCETCKRYIKLRDMQAHQDSNCTFPPVAEPKPAARASPPPQLSPDSSPSTSARMNLLSSMLDSADGAIDPAVLSALLAQSVDFEDPLAAAANRSAASSFSSSIAQKQAREAREKLSRAMDAADRLDDPDDWLPSASPPAARTKPKPVAVGSRAVRGSPPLSAARAPSVPRSQPVAPASAAAGKFECAHCSDKCASLESLQVHILTECHDAHATMESVDPDGAAKALAGLGKQVKQEHVNVKIPIAKPIMSRGSSSSSSASPSAVAASPVNSTSSLATKPLPFDPYDLSWRRPKRDANEELLRHTNARKIASPPAAREVIESDSDEDLEQLLTRKAPTTSAATKPKLMTSNPKLKSNVSSGLGSSVASKRTPSTYDDYDEPISSYLSGSSSSSKASSSTTASRTPFSATPLSLKQQQKDLSTAINARKEATTKPSRAAVASSTRPNATPASLRTYLDDDEDDFTPSRQAPAPKRSSGKFSGVSPSFISELGSDGPKSNSSASSFLANSGRTRAAPITTNKPSSAESDYEVWLARNHPPSSASSNRSGVSNGTPASSGYSSSSYSLGNGSARGPSSPLSSLLGSARVNPVLNGPPSFSSSTASPSSTYIAYTPLSSAALQNAATASTRSDRPSSGARKPISNSPHVPLYSHRPPSPPTSSNYSSKSSNGLGGSGLGVNGRASLGSSATPSSANTRVRAPSAGRSPHIPLRSEPVLFGPGSALGNPAPSSRKIVIKTGSAKKSTPKH